MRAHAPLGFLALSALILAACSSDSSDSDRQAGGEPTAQQSDDSDEATDDTAPEADDDAASSDLNATREGIGDGAITGSVTESGAHATADASSGSVELTVDDSAAEEGSGATPTDAASGDVAGTSDEGSETEVGIDDVEPVVDPTIPEPESQFSAGSLTAGVWDDNLNFDWYSAYRQDFLEGQPVGAPDYGIEKHEAAQELWASGASAKDVLDIALVIDTTGSMGDELGYLQTEFLALASTIDATYANSQQRWSLVLYRDEGDAYVVRHYDFRSDLDEFQTLLAEQSYDGGGDAPEAPEQALDITGQLAWRSGDAAARLAFWVADAPHHEQNVDALEKAVLGLQELDVHLYPVAASGVDPMAEYSMRSAAQLTLGRYLFLTDDSGYGSSHLEPKTPCYYVTSLEDAVLRMVALEMTGKVALPEADDLVRSVGEPDDEGVCAFDSGSTAQAL